MFPPPHWLLTWLFPLPLARADEGPAAYGPVWASGLTVEAPALAGPCWRWRPQGASGCKVLGLWWSCYIPEHGGPASPCTVAAMQLDQELPQHTCNPLVLGA